MRRGENHQGQRGSCEGHHGRPSRSDPASADSGFTIERWLTQAFFRSIVGQAVRFPHTLEISGRNFTHAIIERNFGTKSKAKLIRMYPQGVLFIIKFEDMRLEHAIMSALCAINQRWSERGIMVCGLQVETPTYAIFPLGIDAGLVEVVANSWTFRELSQSVPFNEKHTRVRRALHGVPVHLDRLAASTAAYLTAGYVLGTRDGHDDNLMLRSDGALFRVDFGYVFGQRLDFGFDAPGTFVPNAVRVALGDERWWETMTACGKALHALSGPHSHGRSRDLMTSGPLAWDCIRHVHALSPWLAEARLYVENLSSDAFFRYVRQADEWSFSRSMKNTLRESVQYVFAESEQEAFSEDTSFPASGDHYSHPLNGCTTSTQQHHPQLSPTILAWPY